MKDRLPTNVALSEVSEYSDTIVFGNLGLPVGFDIDQVGVNVRAIERIRAVAGLATVSVIGERGVAGESDPHISGISGGGAATLVGLRRREQKPLGRANVTFPTKDHWIFNPTVVIRTNNAEAEARVRDTEATTNLGIFSPEARVKQLNKGVRTGLVNASLAANVDQNKLKTTLFAYTFSGALMEVSDNLQGAQNSLLATAVATELMVQIGANIGHYLSVISRYSQYPMSQNKTPREHFVAIASITKYIRQGLIAGATIDRHLAATGLAHSSQLIKLRPKT